MCVFVFKGPRCCSSTGTGPLLGSIGGALAPVVGHYKNQLKRIFCHLFYIVVYYLINIIVFSFLTSEN